MSDGPLSIETAGTSVTATCNSVNVEAVVADGVATIRAADVSKLIPACGVREVTWDCGIETIYTTIERVGGRYCTRKDVERYGDKRGDGFADAIRYPDSEFSDAIQQAEEAIEAKRRAAEAAGLDEFDACFTQQTPTGFVRESVLIRLIGKLQQDCDRYLASFGMSPSSRSRVKQSDNRQGALDLGDDAWGAL